MNSPIPHISRRAARRSSALVALALVLGCTTLGSAFASPGAHGPNGEHLDAAGGGSTTSGLARLPDGSVQVPMLAQRRLGVRTVLATETDAAATVQMPGRIVIDPNAGGRIQAVHGGRVEAGPRGLPVAGQAVRKGEVLAFVQHHAEPYALANQQAQLAELRSSRELAAQRVQRLQSLEGTVPRKEIDAARAELQSLSAREKSIGASLGVREALSAPVSGVIARADAVAGQIVEARDVLFEVIDPSRVLVEATTADAALPARVGDASLQGIPGVKLKLLGAARSLREGVLPITFQAQPDKPGAAMPLAVGQPVTVLASLNERIKGFVLPAQAVVRNSANEPIVWIKSGAERYIPQPVQYRALDAGTVIVTQGLGADNRVVVQGAPLIAQIR
ncbi:efflux RND transporter periplasmic adaptor subunit [Variovorax sp. LARHSF232]